MKIIETERITLRTWQESDANIYTQINQDPRVIEFLRGPISLTEAKDFIKVMNSQSILRGYTLWAAEETASSRLMGFIGLNHLTWDIFDDDAVEIGWRLGSEYWGKGYATEGAQAVLKFGFENMGLKEIISFTVPANIRSQRVMEKIGMQRDMQSDFAHPNLPIDHKLSKHILYKITSKGFNLKGK